MSEDDDGMLQITRFVAIPLRELTWRFSRSGGPGGQHANTADTRVEVVFDVLASSLQPHHRERLRAKFGDEVRVVASDERSQRRNRDLALRRLAERLRDGLHVEAPRRPTRPSKAAVRRRLDDKRRQSQRKADRRRPDF